MAFGKTRQGRKQRFRQAFAPNHIRRKAVSSPLSRELRKKAGTRTATLRKGDEVIVMVGKFKKTKAKVSKVDISTSLVHLEGVIRKTVKGREVPVGLRANNLVILTLTERKSKAKTSKVSKQVKPQSIAVKPVAAQATSASTITAAQKPSTQ